VKSLVRGAFFFSLIVLAFLKGCVERYHPDDMYLKEGQLVISAHITDKPGTQVIEVSRSSNPEAPTFNAETGCFVILFREDGEAREFVASEEPGYYTAELDSSFLRTGMLFRVEVITQDDQEYHSDFDKIRPVPAIDSIYYKVEHMIFTGEDESVPGIRFYINFTNDNEDYEYIRWELTETYEFHNPDMDAFYYPNRWRVYPLEGEDNPRTCYITRVVPTGHSISTSELNFGPYSKAFDFVPDDWNEQKLSFKYSLLVKQYSLGPEGYLYWNELGGMRQGQGTLFDKQPALLQSNIRNIEDGEEKVLGFFTMSSVQEIRGFAENIPELEQTINPYYCLPVNSGPGSSSPTTFPAYFARATYNGETVYAQVNKHCVDCREYKGSSATKPDFW
jgi:hypothetical protein